MHEIPNRPPSGRAAVLLVPGLLLFALAACRGDDPVQPAADPVEPPVARQTVASISVISSGALQISGTLLQLTTDPASQFDPSVSGDRVIFTDNRNGDDDVYLVDVATGAETRLTTAATDQRHHDIDGDRVAYTDFTPSLPDLVVLDLAAGTSSTLETPGAQRNPAVSAGRVAYEDARSSLVPEIALFDAVTGTDRVLTATAAWERNPSIAGDLVVYERQSESFAPGDIVLYDLRFDVERVIAGTDDNERNPHTDGVTVVYLRGPALGGDRDVCVHDLPSGVTTCPALPGDQWRPRVDGDWVSFEDLGGSDLDVVLYHIPSGTVHRLDGSGTSELLPDLDGQRVVFTGDASGNLDIYAFDFHVSARAEIRITPSPVDFGDVPVGTSSTELVTVENVGALDLTVSSVGLAIGSGAGLSLGPLPALPVVLVPGASFTVEVTAAPEVEGSISDALVAESDDPFDPMVSVAIVGTGTAAPSPSEQIDDILDLVDQATADGSLSGSGPGGSGEGRLDALRNMLESAKADILAGDVASACATLADALARTDGASPPPDFVTGPAAAELAARIEELRASLGCP